MQQSFLISLLSLLSVQTVSAWQTDFRRGELIITEDWFCLDNLIKST